jgi:hypothetical protein
MGSSFSTLARASTARGRPFGLWKDLTFESQKRKFPCKGYFTVMSDELALCAK